MTRQWNRFINTSRTEYFTATPTVSLWRNQLLQIKTSKQSQAYLLHFLREWSWARACGGIPMTLPIQRHRVNFRCDLISIKRWIIVTIRHREIREGIVVRWELKWMIIIGWLQLTQLLIIIIKLVVTLTGCTLKEWRAVRLQLLCRLWNEIFQVSNALNLKEV